MLKTAQSLEKALEEPQAQQASHSSQAPLHTIRARKPEQSKRPFFFLHGDWTGGPPLFCMTIARSLGSEQPFYALDPYSFNGPYMPLTLEEMATVYLQSLRSVQPEGPYLLGGFCSGAFVAYEIARQLQEQGQEVALLQMIAPAKISDAHKLTRKVLALCGTILQLSQRQRLNLFLYIRHVLRHVYRKVLPPNNAKIKDFPKLLAHDVRLDTLLPPVEALYNDFAGVFTWIAAGYEPAFVPEHAAFVWAGDDHAYKLKWSFAEKSESSVIIPGPYMGLVNENVSLLAERMKQCVSLAQQACGEQG